jgi:hypoxia up-regulated 1
MFGVFARPPRPAFLPKEKKRVHKRTLTIQAYHVGRVQPHTPELIAESKAKLLELAQNDKERMMLEESKNKVESFIYRIKNKLMDDEEEIAKVSTEKQRAECQKLAEDAEEWLYDDGYSADLPTMEDKYAEISVPFEKIELRVAEETARPEAIEKLKSKLTEVEALMTKWETSMPQVTTEEIAKVTVKIKEATTWLEKREKEQAKKKPHQDAAILSSEIPAQFEPIETLVLRLSRKPKPKPVKVKANATATNATDANATATNATDANATETNVTDANATDASASETNATDANATKEDESEEKAESTSEETKTEPVGDDEL